MLVSLRSTIHADIISFTNHFKSEIKAVDGRVTHIENKMGGIRRHSKLGN